MRLAFSEHERRESRDIEAIWRKCTRLTFGEQAKDDLIRDQREAIRYLARELRETRERLSNRGRISSANPSWSGGFIP